MSEWEVRLVAVATSLALFLAGLILGFRRGRACSDRKE